MTTAPVRPLVLLFGGQSSRDPEMFERLTAADAAAGDRARARATRHLGPSPTDFSCNRTIQVSVLAVTLGWLEAVRSRGLQSAASAGLSLGEYAHLVDIGALGADDAVALAAHRGSIYDDGPEGCMAALFPVSWLELAPLVDRIARAHGGSDALAPAVFSAPTQTVVGGSREAVADLREAAEEELSAWSTVIEDRIPMHTPRFAPVAEPFGRVLRETRWRSGTRLPYWPNVTGEAVAAEPEIFVEHLTRHVHEPVLWERTIDRLTGEHPDAVFLETGPGTVLRDLLARRWHPELDVFALDEPDTGAGTAFGRVEAALAGRAP